MAELAISILPVAYVAAIKAWGIFRNCLEYQQDSMDAAIQLEVLRFRFETWGNKAGLTEQRLDPSLIPIATIINQWLERLANLFENADLLIPSGYNL